MGVTEEIRVEWVDIDGGGAAHSSRVLQWAERAEHSLLRSLGIAAASFPRRRIEVEYLAPLVLGDIVKVCLSLRRVGTTSVEYGWAGYCGGVRCFVGATVAVHVSAGVPVRVPSALRALGAKGDSV